MGKLRLKVNLMMSICLEDASDVEYPVDGKLLVVRRSLSVQIKEDEKIQCKNIFHTRCYSI